MDTPICDFVKEYAKGNALRLHMPGHKGASLLGMEKWDITEIPGADVLYHCDGIIKKSQENAAALFGTARTLYSAEGSSLSIRAMLYLALAHGKSHGRPPVILAGRNAHKTFMTAAALLDLQVRWLYPQESDALISCAITPRQLEEALDAMADLPMAVYITSPDYLGNLADIKGLSQVCQKMQVPLLVDHAHGAYLRFLSPSLHPMDLGADLCCDSAHKTLPVLTGGGYLHISPDAPPLFSELASEAMALFASTSPSYLILQSLDAANAYLADGYREKLACFTEKIAHLKARLLAHGYALAGTEPMKITLSPKSFGYTGEAVADYLAHQDIYCEFFDPDFITLMLTPETEEDGLGRLEKALLALPARPPIQEKPPLPGTPEIACSLREAMFAPSQELPVEKCLHRVLAAAHVACPPAVPILVSGEKIDEAALRCFQYYGVTHCRVVK
ncbi:MAG: amino acid decarboxylase [Clostridiales bacterium]|nr:amino acid decarboxylase [Clostridiales bacterium]